LQNLLFLSTAAIALAAATTPAWAEMRPAEVGEIVVTANRSPERADRVGQSVTVVDAAELAARQTPVLTEILATLPGVSFSQNGPVGSVAQVYIRGAQPGQTVVLIDGVKLNNPAAPDSAYNFGNLLVGDVSRVEVLRGPQSVLWGSQAIGGVINLITAEPQKPFESDLTAEGGSYDWAYGRAGLGGKTDRVAWRAAAAYLTTTGVSAFDQGREPDGYHNVGATGRAEVTITDQLSLDLRGYYSRGRADFDGFPPPNFTFADTNEYGVTTDLVGYAGLNLALLDGRLKNRLAYAYTRSDLKDYNPDQAVTDVTFASRGRNERVEYQGTFAVTQAWTAVFGAESELSSMLTNAPSEFDPAPPTVSRSARLNSFYLQARGDVLPGLTLTGGLRHDHHSDFGGHTVGQAALAWRLNGGATLLRASWGQGFKAPSLYQLGSDYGNANLRPETASGWDAGVEQRLAGGRAVVSATYFDRHTKDEIEFFTCLFGTGDPLCVGQNGLFRFGYYANIGRTKARGVELSGQAQLTEALTFDANYTWLDARNDTPDSFAFGNRLARRPEHQANADLAYRWPNDLSTAVAARFVGERFDDIGNTVRLKSYTLWDIRASYPVTGAFEVYGRIENLFDKRYETIAGYGQLGRAAYAGVRARF
jgi:vitamin B12 transporter